MSVVTRGVGKLRPESSALFLCDIQENFRSVISHMDSLLARSALITKGARALGVKAVITEQYPKGLGHTCSELNDALTTPLIDDGPTGTIAKGGEAAGDNNTATVFEKTRFSMVTDDVSAHLKSESMSHVKDIVIVGLETHICVTQTTLDLLEMGYNVHLAADAVSSRFPVDRKIGLERLAAAGAWVTTTESVLFQWCGDAKHPNFKFISKLVRPQLPPTGLE